MKCKNKVIELQGLIYNDITGYTSKALLRCICTNDEKGKTLSIDNGIIQYTIPFEELAEIFKDGYK